MPKIIPARGLDFAGAGGLAEKKTLDALKELPEDYYILRECKLIPSEQKQASGSQEDRPDFIVIGPELGILVLEVKDWNIRLNEFKLTDQIMIDKVDRQSKTITSIKNPWHQAEEYAWAVKNQLKIIPRNEQLCITWAVVYSKLNRYEFRDVYENPQPYNPQARWQIDLSKTLFRDDIINKSQNELLITLRNYVKKHVSDFACRHALSYNQQQIKTVVERLIPAEMRVGGLPEQNEATQKFAILDEEQQKWAIGKAFEDKKYLSDVAGSGKTNVLLSRAIYQAKLHHDRGGCRILITTYNTALKHELERIFKAKIMHDPLENYYRTRIFIYDIVTVMEDIMKEALQDDFADWKKNLNVPSTYYIEKKLPQECIEIIEKEPREHEIYDHLFVDEVQDFSTEFLKVAMGLLKKKNNFFAVGDIGQKIFDRAIEWWDFDIGPERVALQSQFLMYRSPQPVAKLAWQFLLADPFIRQELVDEKYETKIKPKSPLQTHPNFISFSNEDELLQSLIEDIGDYLQTDLPRKILCIGLKNGVLPLLQRKLMDLNMPVRWATDAIVSSGDYILLADYIEAKGLERDYVFIVDADHLAQPQGVCESDEQHEKHTRKDRIKLFIALTRAMRTVRLYYVDRQHPFVREINQLQTERGM